MGLPFSRSVVLPATRTILTMLTTPPLRPFPPAPAPFTSGALSPRLFLSTKATLRPLKHIPHELQSEHYVPAATTAEYALYSAIDTPTILYLRLNMPGVGPDGVGVGFDPVSEKLVVTADPDIDGDGGLVAYEYDGFVVPARFFCTDRIEHAMSHGMLMLTVPKKVPGKLVVCKDGFTFSIVNDDAA